MSITMRSLLLLSLVLSLSVVQGRHIHPRSVVRLGEVVVEDEEKSGKIIAEIDSIPIDVYRRIKQNRFVPINRELFFKIYPPCKEGLERDALGICREVWD